MRVESRLSMGLSPLLGITMGLAGSALATTLEQLSLDEMARQSTAIVRARVMGSHAATRSGNIYTYFQIQVLENWKGQGSTEVAVPGGEVDGIRQSVTGAPELKTGQEYVLFLWTSRSGLTQVIGFSQGLFKVSEEGSEGGGGVAFARRPAASELMLDRSGRPVEDRPLRIELSHLRARVREALGVAKLGAAK
jgi:hypothetical protein